MAYFAIKDLPICLAKAALILKFGHLGSLEQ
jgi:hypothetical protein